MVGQISIKGMVWFHQRVPDQFGYVIMEVIFEEFGFQRLFGTDVVLANW